jgi:hypothetical protein
LTDTSEVKVEGGATNSGKSWRIREKAFGKERRWCGTGRSDIFRMEGIVQQYSSKKPMLK